MQTVLRIGMEPFLAVMQDAQPKQHQVKTYDKKYFQLELNALCDAASMMHLENQWKPFLQEFCRDADAIKRALADARASLDMHDLEPLLRDPEFIQFARQLKKEYGWSFGSTDAYYLCALYTDEDAASRQKHIFSPTALAALREHPGLAGPKTLRWIELYLKYPTRIVNATERLHELFNYALEAESDPDRFNAVVHEYWKEEERLLELKSRKLFQTLTATGYRFQPDDLSSLTHLANYCDTDKLRLLIERLHEIFGYAFQLTDSFDLATCVRNARLETKDLEEMRELLHGANPEEKKYSLLHFVRKLSSPERRALVKKLMPYGYRFHLDDDHTALQRLKDPAVWTRLESVLDMLHRHDASFVFSIDQLSSLLLLAEHPDRLSEATAFVYEKPKTALLPGCTRLELYYAAKGDVSLARNIDAGLINLIKDHPDTLEESGTYEGFVQGQHGDDPVDISDSAAMANDERVFFESALLPGRELFSVEERRWLLGHELACELDDLDARLIDFVQRLQDPQKIIDAITRKSAGLMLHATRYDRTNATVQKIVGKHGLKLMGKENTVGAFMAPVAPEYANPNLRNGNVVLMFADDLRRSHIGIMRDPAGDSGYVAADAYGDLVRVSARCTLNPGPRSVSVDEPGGETIQADLDGVQSMLYLILQRLAVRASPELSDALRQREDRLVAEFGKEYEARCVFLYADMRARGYPEAAILERRDYYTELKLRELLAHSTTTSDDKKTDPQALYIVERLLDDARRWHPELDVALLLDQLREYWPGVYVQDISDQGASAYLDLKTELAGMEDGPVSEITATLQRFVRRLQRRQILKALHQARTDGTRKRWTDNHDNPPRSASELLSRTRDLLLGPITEAATAPLLERVTETGKEVMELRRAMLREAWCQATSGYDTTGACCILAGSVARGEGTLFSDIDYEIILDNDLASDDVQNRIHAINDAVANILETKHQQNVDQSGVIFSNELDSLDRYTVAKLIDGILVEPSAQNERLRLHLREQVLARYQGWLPDLSNVDYWGTLWHKARAQLMSGDTLRDFKHEVQRILTTGMTAILIAYQKDYPHQALPALTSDKIAFLRDHRVLTPEEARRLQGFYAMVYRLRFRADVLTPSLKYAEENYTAEGQGLVDPIMLTVYERQCFMEDARWFTDFFARKLNQPIPRQGTRDA